MYDQYILKGILLGMNPYFISKRIIEDNVKGFNVVREGYKIPLNNFDITTGFHSLKQLEGFMGSRIKESSVPFDIDRPLTPEEIKEVIDYCIHDVKQTIEVFDNKKVEFESQLALIEAFNLNMSMFTKTKAQLSAFILGAEKHENREDEFDLQFPKTLKVEKYKHIVEWYKDPENLDYSKKLKVDVAGVPHIFAWGGLHGAIPKYKDEGIILCCDVASLYPSIMIEYSYISRNVRDPLKYNEIRDTRLELKRKKDPKQAPYKIVLNSTYGAMKDQYNPLYDPLMANNVCLAGQLLLLDLIEKIEPYCKLIQSNTDGLFMKVEKESDIDVIKEVAKEWENRTRLTLEWDVYEKIYQKDVNNYIIIDGNQNYKSKGAYVKKLNNLDYDLPIVNKAMIEYFTKNIPVEETINNCKQLREFQKIVKVSNKYKYALHGEEKLPEKVLRVFASKKEDAKGVFKVKNEERIEKIANTPEKCFIDNDDVKTKEIPSYLDKDYYISVAKKRIDDFLKTPKKGKKKD
ncbi:DNA polymerase domain-containing protein [Bacillus glycinifermentans]|uniref:DNA polymerase domain-containing protein n=2 Tax=Bacillus glycinifermentans TaxID=1664069 RepID=A0ABU6H9U7_9BACI|nr:DNA polymerase domain-containing protein [Bacillus glycinifermentans]MEC0487324.1 DNA polymerase domain-containing protein [Bacillus glycinifermentans]